VIGRSFYKEASIEEFCVAFFCSIFDEIIVHQSGRRKVLVGSHKNEDLRAFCDHGESGLSDVGCGVGCDGIVG
jgi:hypothetical protein